jgi:hypothetical protein
MFSQTESNQNWERDSLVFKSFQIGRWREYLLCNYPDVIGGPLSFEFPARLIAFVRRRLASSTPLASIPSFYPLPQFPPSKMVPTTDLSLPIISFKSPTVADEIRNACLTHGFYQLIDHPITQEMQDETLATMKSFFSLPTDVKMQLLRTDDRAGYEAMQSQKLEKGTIPNVKEGYYVGAPGHVWTGTKFGDNTWPQDPKYEKVFMAYYRAVYDLSKQLFAILSSIVETSRNVL